MIRLLALVAAVASISAAPVPKPAQIASVIPGDDWIEDINQAVNRRIQYVPADSFAPNEAFGDCKTYAATKRRHLIQAGMDPKRLSIWLSHDDEGEGHAVLIVDGWRVLDNRFAHSTSKEALIYGGYRFERACPKCDAAADASDTTRAEIITGAH